MRLGEAADADDQGFPLDGDRLVHAGAREPISRELGERRILDAAIGRAVTARRPRTRYAVGGGAKPILLLRRLLTDRAYDRMTVRMFRPSATGMPAVSRAPTS